jgi:flagellar biosynthetic protein FlhB
VAEQQEDRSREDLTEDASPHRIEEYRSKGQVAQSRELAGMAALIAAGVATYAVGPSMAESLSEFMKEAFRTDLASRVDLSSGDVLRTYLFKALHITGAVGMPICIAGFVFGALASFGQIGSIWSTDPLTPDFGKINPIAGFKRLFSLKQVMEAARLIFKMIVVCGIAYALVKSEVLRSGGYMVSDPRMLGEAFASSAKTIFMALCAALVIFATGDFLLQRWEFSKNLRMTKQEAKQEHKEREGDPQIKARIRAVQREVARRRMMQAVKKADVIITNPTHIAIAISYEKDKMLAPKVVAKGADYLAQRIKKIAAENGVPMVENVPLARTLFKTVKVNQYVPRVLFQAIAEVLAYVYRLKGVVGRGPDRPERMS